MAFNILIVDDSATTRAVIRRTILLSGLTVGQIHDAADGQAALDLLARQRVDLVLADLNMPRMNGVEMIRRMDADDLLCSVPVLVISAEPNAVTLSPPLRSGGPRGHVRKPFTPEEIRKAVTAILEVNHA